MVVMGLSWLSGWGEGRQQWTLRIRPFEGSQRRPGARHPHLLQHLRACVRCATVVKGGGVVLVRWWLMVVGSSQLSGWGEGHQQ